MGGKDLSVREIVCSFTSLHAAMLKCRKNVMWKDSVAKMVNHSITTIQKLKESLDNGTYEISPYSNFVIKEPKERHITSTRFKDRIFQRSLCDNYAYKEITKDFIKDNYACQKDKGTDRAREALDQKLRQFFKEHKLNGYFLKIDIHDYFGSTSHEVAKAAVRKRISDDWAYQELARVIDSFPRGIGLGSQVSQLVQLAVLADLDSAIVNDLGIKYYVRYMDDLIIIHESKEKLQDCLDYVRSYLSSIELTLNQKKTTIQPISHPIKFLGFSFLLHKTSKVTWKLSKDSEKRERKKLKDLKRRLDLGHITKEKMDECYSSWRAHAKKSDSRGRILKMDAFYKSLWR